VLDDSLPIRGIRKAVTENLGVLHRLLQAIARVLVFGFGFDNRNRKVGAITQDVIRAFLFFACVTRAERNDAPICERDLLMDLVIIPTRAVQFWDYIGSASVGFSHL